MPMESKAWQLKTRMGEITFAGPRMHERCFFWEVFEIGIRHESALKLTMAEMYVHGESTWKVSTILEQLSGTKFSASTVGDVITQMENSLDKWKNCLIEEAVNSFLDAFWRRTFGWIYSRRFHPHWNWHWIKLKRKL